MSTPFPSPVFRTPAEWQALAATPDKAARTLHETIESWPESVRRAVLADLRPERTLAGNFAASSLADDSPLRGVPVMIKDLFDEAAVVTRAGSTFLPEVRPAPVADGALVRALREAGAVIAGRTHLNEFAYGLEGQNPHYGDVPHPLWPDRLSGGSSSGSAFAVAAGWVPVAFGTDTGGSVRVPAAFTGSYGARLSPNIYTFDGCFPLSPSYDTAGWFARRPEDLRAVLNLLAPSQQTLGSGRGIWVCPAAARVEPIVLTGARALAGVLGAGDDASVQDAFSDVLDGAETAYSVLQSTEALQVHHEWLDRYRDRYDPLTWQRIDRARRWTPDQLADAAQRRDRLLDLVAATFVEYDFIAMPATPAAAPTKAGHDDNFRIRSLRLTCLGSLARTPALSIPYSLPNGATSGLQILYREGTQTGARILEACEVNAAQARDR